MIDYAPPPPNPFAPLASAGSPPQIKFPISLSVYQ